MMCPEKGILCAEQSLSALKRTLADLQASAKHWSGRTSSCFDKFCFGWASSWEIQHQAYGLDQ